MQIPINPHVKYKEKPACDDSYCKTSSVFVYLGLVSCTCIYSECRNVYIIPANAGEYNGRVPHLSCFSFFCNLEAKSVMLMTSTRLFPGQMVENAPSECAQIKSYFCLSLISSLTFSLLSPSFLLSSFSCSN